MTFGPNLASYFLILASLSMQSTITFLGNHVLLRSWVLVVGVNIKREIRGIYLSLKSDMVIW